MLKIVTLFLGFCSLFISTFAWAEIPDELQVIDESKLVELHSSTNLSIAAFEEKTVFLSRTADAEDDISYRIRLPKDWLLTKQDKLKYEVVGGQIVGTIAEYVSQHHPLGRAKITISSQPTFRDIHIKDLFLAKNLAQGASIRAMDITNLHEIEGEVVRQINDDALVLRTKLFLHGPRLISVDFSVPVRRYIELKDMQARVIQSFEFLSKPNQELEEKRIFAFLNERKMSYPRGLEITSKRVFSNNHITVRFLNNDTSGFPNGAIRFDVYRQTGGINISAKVEEIKAGFFTPEQSVSDVVETLEYTMSDNFKDQDFKIYAIKERLNKFEADKLGAIKNELLVAVFSDDEFDYIATIFMPTRKNNLTEWSRNMRAFQIMMETLGEIPAPDVFPPESGMNESDSLGLQKD